MEAPESANGRGLYCNRTLNLRNIEAIGYDLDYTLVHYRVAVWEELAWTHLFDKLAEDGWPVEGLDFDPDFALPGLILDLELGNLVKADRFGFVKRACHGTRQLGWAEVRRSYARTVVDLRSDRWVFLNSWFNISEATMVLQLVDRLDARLLRGVLGYRDLWDRVRASLGLAHTEGRLKSQVLADPLSFVDIDPDTAQTLLDQKAAGKLLLLITNSEFAYAEAMLEVAIDPFLPGDMTWRALFDAAFFAARKPAFFMGSMPTFDVVDGSGLLRPHVGDVTRGGIYVGGDAGLVERSFGLTGDAILYVGDHVQTDVNVTKQVLRWRTALILRAVEEEVQALSAFAPQLMQLSELMEAKESLERRRDALRLQSLEPSATVDAQLGKLHAELDALDSQITPLATEAGTLVSARWGPLLRTGNDKSHLARQVERYADIYTSRVSNFRAATPFAYVRSPRSRLPHDP